MNKTDLARILSVSGQSGLYQYVAQARNGAIAEKLDDRKRVAFGSNAKITTLEDIAIYTSEGELRLAEVFNALHTTLGEEDAPTAKSDSKTLESLFAKAIPNYDADRFYVSHMKKVVTWYNELKKHASLDFMTQEEREAAYKAENEEA